MAGKLAYIKPVHTLVASNTRVPEQIRGRLLFVKTERLNSGSEKVIAVMVDKNKKFELKSVLVHEAWAPADQARLRRSFKSLEGKVVSITHAKIVPKAKTSVFFDSCVKSAFDQYTTVAECPEDDSYPTQLPVLPNLQAAACLAHDSIVSVVAVVTVEGQMVQRTVAPKVKKLVTNLKMVVGRTNMAAAFWNELAEKMGSAKSGQVYRLDWVLFKQEARGTYCLASVPATAAELVEGETATAVQASPADTTETNEGELEFKRTLDMTCARSEPKRLRLVQTDSLGDIL